MVKIRYAELPAGLHVATEERDGCTIVYLQPGLTPEQRKAALTLARRSARLGHGPSLPGIDMALAVAADRARTTARVAGRAMRKHPLLMLPVLALIASLIVGIMVSVLPVGATPSRPTDPASAVLKTPGGGFSPHRPGRPSPERTATPAPQMAPSAPRITSTPPAAASSTPPAPSTSPAPTSPPPSVSPPPSASPSPSPSRPV